ncbi:hypothetical protein [Chachezhania antarctica]|uniref:hypothetical protein n=1 Tax=Chachezhania antarctica TaxID=2340860 RepID=UPI0013CE7FED|nr:hypothetical protein [Chachezhania antarctica]|tara:strand:+ start:5123 stop:5290 length:168 start_codon:yes stop_codon:yes gene_type:complete
MSTIAAAIRPLYAPIVRTARAGTRRLMSGWWILPAAVLGLCIWIGVLWMIFKAVF